MSMSGYKKDKDMTFTFVKPKLTAVNDKPINIEYGWMLVLDSIQAVNEYMQTIQKGIIGEGIEKLMTKDYSFHCTSKWEYVVEVMATCKAPTTFLEQSIELENMLYRSRINIVLKYGKMYINESGGGFPHSDDIEIVEEITKDSIVWPQHSKSDIQVIKWPGGKHYYAKIGNADVVDDSGNQKWNSKKEALRVAEKFLIGMN